MPVCLGKSQGLNDAGHWWGRAAAPCSLYLLFPAPSGGPPQGGAQTGNKGDPENRLCILVRNMGDPPAYPHPTHPGHDGGRAAACSRRAEDGVSLFLLVSPGVRAQFLAIHPLKDILVVSSLGLL